MATNDFQPFAIAASANVTDQADYVASPALLSGFSSGVAPSAQVNKALRQGTVMASVMARFISDQTSADVLDNGDTDTLGTQFLTAMKNLISANELAFNTIYPIGVVMFFAQNKNPNTLFPGTTWNYIGANQTIRLGVQSGTDVLTTGGSDTVTIVQSNLPAVALSVSGTAASVNLGSVVTDTQGNHAHTWGSAMQKAGGSDQNVGSNSNDTFGTTSTNGAHAHNVALGAHSHSVSGGTSNLGSGAALNVTNAYVKLMGWYRSA